MAFCIEKFSSWFCLVYSTDMSEIVSYLGSDSLPQLNIDTKRVKDIIRQLHCMYKAELSDTIEKIDNSKSFSCYRSYMKAILLRCKKLSTNPSYIHFMLVCTFIYALIREQFERDTKCFFLPKLASQCLEAVFHKCYSDFFKNQSETLDSYCKNLNTTLATRMTGSGKRGLPLFTDQITPLMASLVKVDRKKSSLGNLGMRVLDIDTESFLAEDSPDIEEPTSSSESESSSDEEGVKKTANYYRKRNCNYCGRKCFGYVLSYARVHEDRESNL